MRVVYFGSGDFAVPALRSIWHSEHELVLAVTQPDRGAGRGKSVTPTPVARQAEEDGIPVQRCEDVNDPQFVEKIAGLQADIGVVAAFGQKLRESIRTVFPQGCINAHASLLPKYRGASPIHRAVWAGDSKTGVTVFKLVDKMDAGPILIRRFTAIGPNETTGELHDRLSGIACDALHAALDLLQTQPDYAAEEQDESEVSLAPKLNKSDGSVDWTQSADQIVNHCRAMTPWPGARTRFIPQEGKPIEISLEAVSASPTSSNLEPGTLTDILSVSTGSGTLEVHGLQPAGGKSMSWQEFVNGRHVQPGDRFETLGRD